MFKSRKCAPILNAEGGIGSGAIFFLVKGGADIDVHFLKVGKNLLKTPGKR